MVTPPPMQLATLGWEDSLLLMVLALVVFGPRRLPLIGKQIGKLMYEFRKASNDFKFQMEEELRAAEEADRRKKEEAERQRVAAIAAQSQASVSAPPQAVEAAADIGAVEPATAPAYPEQYPPEPAATSTEPTETVPVIQPPRTGEPVSAARPDYHFAVSDKNTAVGAATAEVNPEADVAANAEGVSAAGTGTAECPNPESIAPEIITPETASSLPPNHTGDYTGGQDPSPAASPKETVSQHG